MYLDESELVWAAALVEDVDPAELLARVDVASLATIVADADEATGPIDAAARLLVRVVRDRPFLNGNAAIGWLAAVEVLAAAGWRVSVRRARVVGLCGDIREGVLGHADAASALRRWVVEDGIACPACGRRVYTRDAAAGRRLMPGGSRFELTAAPRSSTDTTIDPVGLSWRRASAGSSRAGQCSLAGRAGRSC